ncbi:MAG: phosphoenolpyruvate synthase [Propionibacteriales bacterium]|nr:phosphoenolpyruvate synthase [Propionibacteriales bacterium]
MHVRQFGNISRADLDQVGGKAANLGELSTAGLPVPPGFVLSTSAYLDFLALQGIAGQVLELARAAQPDDPAGNEAIADRIASLINNTPVPADVAAEVTAARQALGADRVAVRSSATAEDLAGASFAGQQETYLNIAGDDDLLDAVRQCWASLWTARAVTYRLRQQIPPEDVALAVVVQQMVDADAAGVMFTANPATGRRHETAISAAWGLGESVVSGQVDTDELVVDTSTHAVMTRATADKLIMVVPTDAGTETVPVPEPSRRAAVLTDAQAIVLAAWGARISEHYGTPQDVEWALDGTMFMITQARPITALPPVSGPEPTDWSVPRRHAMYVRASIVEQLPDPLTPLFADVASDRVIAGLVQTMADVLGRDDLFTTEGVTFETINGYAYYAYGNAAMAKLMGQVTLSLPSVLTKGIAGGPRHWAEVDHPHYRALVDAQSDKDPTSMASRELINLAQDLAQAGFAYYTAVQTVIPAVAMSEVAFTAFCRRIRKPGDPSPETLLFGYDSAPIRAEKSLYDLAGWTRDEGLASALLAGDAVPETTPDDVDHELFATWRQRFAEHLDQYGHAVYNLDFATPMAADTPALLWDVFTHYLRGEGKDPHVRQHEAIRAREEGTATIAAHLSRPLRRTFQQLLATAQRLAPIREDALADVGLAWPTIRRFLLAVGDRLQTAGAVQDRTDVFWLRLAELEELSADLDAGAQTLPTRSTVIEERRIQWRGQGLVTPPALLPARSVWRIFDRWMPSASADQTGDVIKGIGGSGGTVTAPARVLHGPGDFGEMRNGEVLVAAITTPAWTPLFAMASGVVTDIGGPLSHSSIVAREYGIPAVLGTGVATKRLTSGQQVTLDGTAGTVSVLA